MNNIWSLKYFLMFLLTFMLLLIMLIILIKNAKGNRFRTIVGYFKNFKTNNIISLSLIITNFVFIVFNLIMKMEINLFIISISIGLILISSAVNFEIKNMLVNNLLNLVNCFVLYTSGKVNIIRINSNEKKFYILQILMNFLGLVFFIFTTLKFCKNTRGKE